MTYLLLFVTLLLVLINGFFVAAEFSLVRAKASLLENHATRRARRLASQVAPR